MHLGCSNSKKTVAPPIGGRGGTHSHDSSLHTFLARRNAVMTFLFPQRGGAHIPMILVYILLQPVVIRGAAFSEPKAFQFIRSTLFCRIRNLNPIEALERVATYEGYIWAQNFSKSVNQKLYPVINPVSNRKISGNGIGIEAF